MQKPHPLNNMRENVHIIKFVKNKLHFYNLFNFKQGVISILKNKKTLSLLLFYKFDNIMYIFFMINLL